MFCFQCEQTSSGTGCNNVGTCGKTPDTSGLQDLLVHGVKILAWYVHNARQTAPGLQVDAALYHFVITGLFTTLTNVNFDNTAILPMIQTCLEHIDTAKALYLDACKQAGREPATLDAMPMPEAEALTASNMADLVTHSKLVGVLATYQRAQSDDVAGVLEMLIYGLKGVAAYTDHCIVAGVEDVAVYEHMVEALAFTLSEDRNDLGCVARAFPARLLL